MIRDTLCLDHFFLGFDSNQFQDLKKLTRIFSACKFSKVKSGKDSWEGIYLKTNIGSYFEIVENRDKYGLGIACSPVTPHYTNAKLILKEMPELNWSKGTRTFGKTRKTWFEHFSVKSNQKHIQDYDPFFSWIMHYHSIHNTNRLTRMPQASIERFNEMNLELGKEHLELINLHTSWMPIHQKSKSNTSVTLKIYDRDSGLFTIKIQIIKGADTPRFTSLKMQLCHTARYSPMQLDHFKINKSGNIIELRAK